MIWDAQALVWIVRSDVPRPHEALSEASPGLGRAASIEELVTGPAQPRHANDHIAALLLLVEWIAVVSVVEDEATVWGKLREVLTGTLQPQVIVVGATRFPQTLAVHLLEWPQTYRCCR